MNIIKGAIINNRFKINVKGRLPSETRTAGNKKNGMSPVISYYEEAVTARIKIRVVMSFTQGLRRWIKVSWVESASR